MSWGLAKRSILIFIPLAVLAAVVMFLLYRTEVDAGTQATASNEARIVDVGRQRISVTLTSAIADLIYLSNQGVLQDWLVAPDLMAERRLIGEYIAFTGHKEVYNQIRFIDLAGHEDIRVDWDVTGAVVTPREALQDKSDRYYVKAAQDLKKGEIYVSGFDLHHEHGVIAEPRKPVIRLVTPVFDASGDKKGFIVLSYMGRNLIKRVRSIGETGSSQAWLVNSAGYWLAGPTPDDEWGFMYPDRQDRRIEQKFPAAWQAMKGATGSLQFMADGGLFTVARASPGAEATDDNAIGRGEVKIADAPTWYLISYLPQAVLTAQGDAGRRNFVIGYAALLLLLMAVSVGIALLATRLGVKTRVLSDTETYFRAAAEGGLNAFFIFTAMRAPGTEAPGKTGGPVPAMPGGDNLVLEYLNPLAEKMIAASLAEARGRSVSAVMHGLHGEGKSVANNNARDAVQLGTADDIGSEIQRYHLALSDGQVRQWAYQVTAGAFAGRHFEEEIVPLPNGIAVSCRDITERKQIEGLKSEFVSTVSHELRTPLTAIRGALGLIVNGVSGELPAEVKGMLNIAYNNCERLVRLINDILDIEKIESGRMPFNIRQLTVAPFLRQSIELNAAFAEKYGVTTVLQPPADIAAPESVALLADSDRLVQVMTNLLSNATKFSRKGGTVTVSWQVVGKQVRIAVQDHGLGIPESFRNSIFQKFAQADSSDSRAKGGTGLGLSIVKAIVEQMSGEIGFDSVEFEGSTFYFLLPLAEPLTHPQAQTGGQSAAHPMAQLALADLAPAARALLPGRGQRLLICEDEVDIANLLRMILERAGFQIDVTHDGGSALAALQQHSYFALVLDLMLPDVCGISIVREIRADPKLQALPIVVVSAKAETGRRFLRGDAIGMVDWMVKPIDADRLVQVVQGLFSRATGARVLHVEDDGDIAEVIRQSMSGFAGVTSVPSLAAAQEQLATRQFDLVILDIGLPDGSGLDLLPVLGTGGRYPTPIVLFTASEVPLEISEQVEAVLIKSKTSEQKLLDTIRQLIAMAAPDAAQQTSDA